MEIVSIVRPPDGLTANVSDEPSAYWASIPAPVLRNTPMDIRRIAGVGHCAQLLIDEFEHGFLHSAIEPMISRAMAPFRGHQRDRQPSIAISFLPTITSSDGDGAPAVSLGGAAVASGAAAKPFVVIPAKHTQATQLSHSTFNASIGICRIGRGDSRAIGGP